MLDAADTLATILAGASLGLTQGTNLFKGPMPEAGLASDGTPLAPAKCVSVLPTGGAQPQGFIGQGKKSMLYPRCQIRVRSDAEDFSGGQTLAFGIHEALNQTTSGSVFAIQCRESSPFYGGTDSAGRHLWALNVDLGYVNSPA
jgi:hypothetical protein